MEYELIAPTTAKLDAFDQGASSADALVLQRQLVETQLRVSDLGVRVEQLREQQSRAVGEQERLRFNEPLAEAQHEYTKASIELQVRQARMAKLQAGTAVPPRHDGLIDRSMLEKTGTGMFLLMIPIVFALARRIWVSSGPRREQVIDIEASPRLQRLEEAIDSIAIEVERIGEGQRFATKLLSERPEPVVNRPAPASTPSVRKAPGTITPH
jgi:hypothetical protein